MDIFKSTFVSFALVGTIGFLADTALLYALLDSLGPFAGRAISFAYAVTVTWMLNRHFTFADEKSQRPLGTEYGLYFISMLGGGAVNYGVYAVLIMNLGAVQAMPVTGVAAGSVAGLVVNFILSRRVVFASGQGKSAS